jgi:Holliday junction resolvasome RuvABC ATP-dependent DNA helicase subunit|tara:strand:+ start:64 stop:465 length:402 start_codon:yes stop_codon:yes gene_type:complete
MSEWLDSILQYSENEMKLLNFDKNGLSDVIIKFIKELHGHVGNQPVIMKSILKNIQDLIDKKPIALITEKDFVDDICTRYEYIYKAQNGRYYNDRAVVFKKGNDTQYIYQGQNRSKQEITLPYFLHEETVLLP